MARTWIDSIREALPDSGPTYRHDISTVAASSIAQQFYCEAKVENAYSHGEIPVEARDVGSDLHDEIFAMEKVEREELIKNISERPTVTASFLLHSRIEDILVVGIPDAVIFEKGRPRWVIELKTTKGDVARLWKDQEVQVRIYGLLLEQMGFDCSDLTLSLVRVRQDEARPSPTRDLLLPVMITALLEGNTSRLETTFRMKFFLMPHDRPKAREAIGWAKGYWLKERDAIPTTVAGKCRHCEYNPVCDHSLFRPNDR